MSAKSEGYSSPYEGMLTRYAILLRQMKETKLTSAALDLAAEEIEGIPLPKKEKELHRTLLQQLSEINAKVEKLHWMSEHLKIVHDFQQASTQTFNKEKIYEQAFELVSRVMDTDAFFIALYREGDEYIRIPFAVDDGVRYEEEMRFGEGITSQVLKTRRTIHIYTEKESSEKTIMRWGNPAQDTNTLIFVPMILRDEVKGVITAQSYREFAYKQEHEELLEMIGTQIASAIETAELYDRVYELSIKDELTGLKNRRAFQIDLRNRLHAAKKQGQSLALLMIDSDRLKEANDTYGHHVGDMLLRRIAESMQQALGPEDEAYRYAGDEFIVLSFGADREAAVEKAMNMQKHLSLHPIIIDGQTLTASLSIGIDIYPDSASTEEELQQQADSALYFAKKQGRNTITVYQRPLF
ncbi:sensor domain-containing diguanylate cyclase [Aneurinibacillus sp. REN35]|uniref:sensor domain-containing diguanylate cyclase n=1 Tax=Aneurinibacillus sp. REN35 TaxID=3237286 RepID=UPI003527D7D0